MSSYKTKDIESALLIKGFRFENKKRHKTYRYYAGDKKTGIMTIFSRGKNEYSDHLLAAVRNQISLTQSEFDDLVKCPLTKEKLHELYLEKEVV